MCNVVSSCTAGLLERVALVVAAGGGVSGSPSRRSQSWLYIIAMHNNY